MTVEFKETAKSFSLGELITRRQLFTLFVELGYFRMPKHINSQEIEELEFRDFTLLLRKLEDCYYTNRIKKKDALKFFLALNSVWAEDREIEKANIFNTTMMMK